jgi:hypothetical protein
VSGILECDGVFQVPVPDGWSVTGQPGRAYDLSHDSEDVGVNISVYRRSATGEDIEAALRRFAVSAGADGSAVRVVMTDDDKRQTRAFTRFSTGDRDWLAAFIYLGDAAVLATSNARLGDSSAFATGEQVVASLGPIAGKLGFLRRK